MSNYIICVLAVIIVACMQCSHAFVVRNVIHRLAHSSTIKKMNPAHFDDQFDNFDDDYPVMYRFDYNIINSLYWKRAC